MGPRGTTGEKRRREKRRREKRRREKRRKEKRRRWPVNTHVKV